MPAATDKFEEQKGLAGETISVKIPASVIIAVRNEARNLPRCLESLRDFEEIYVVDSASADATTEIGRSNGAKVVQFHYNGGWPRKRQWAMDTLPVACDWILLVDADESLTQPLIQEIRESIRAPELDGYYIELQMFFLGRRLKYCGAGFQKLSLFRRGKGRFECRTQNQNPSMGDTEVHEHIVVDGKTDRLKNVLIHNNVESLYRYIQKHNEYSNWEAEVRCSETGLQPALFGSQAQRRRWLRKMFFGVPGSPLAFFLYRYIFRLGFLDGIPGLIYCGMQGIQFFHIKAKIYESRPKKG